MASDLSSGSTEVNDILDDEKEEGEISLEDVSSSEDGPIYKYLPKAFGQCRYCLSTQHCATWCSSLTINKNSIKRDAGLQGKENRSNRRYHKDGLDVPILGNSSSSKTIPHSSSTLQEKNDDDALGATANSDLVPISSDSDMEVVGLTYEKHEKKSSRRRKMRKKHRKKSPDTLSLSLSPSSQDLTLSIKDSIHRLERDRFESGHSKHRHQHSPDRRKLASRPSSPARRRNRSPLTSRSGRHRTSRSPLKKSSPSRSRKTVQRKSSTLESVSPVKQSFNKLLKKVRNLEPSHKNKETGSSLKDKLNNIIKHDKKETSTAVKKNKEPSVEPALKEKPKPALKDKKEEVQEKEEVVKKPVVVEEEKSEKKNSNNKEEDEEDLVVLRQIALKTKVNKNVALIRPEDIKSEPIDESLESPAPPPPPPPLSSPPPPPLPPPLPPPQEPPPLSPQPSKPALSELQQPQQSQQKAEDKTEHKLPNFCMDDNDEDLQLRMIALRSAVIKKHRSRIARGRRKKPETAMPRIESPFTSTFLEDFPMLAEICSPASPLNSKRDILLAEDMELDSDMELAALSDPEDQSPYSPSDDITGELLLEHEISQPEPVTSPAVQPIEKNRSLYSPSNPTETPGFAAQQSMAQHPERNILDGSILELTSQESRPYSPSDATVYDPDLPGVHSPLKSVTPTTTTTTNLASLPLQPPPMPPLSMFGPRQPMLLGCPPNMLNVFGDPIAVVPPPMVTSFPALHQSVNPLLLPSAPSLFAYPTTHSTAVSIPQQPPPPPPPPPPSPPPSPPPTTTTTPIPSMSESNELDDFMETDLDGSPLVPIEKDGNEQRWQIMGEPLYLQNVPELTQSELSKLPTLMERSLVPVAVLRSNKQLQKQPLKKLMPPVGETLFRNADMRPVLMDEKMDVRAACFKPIKLQAQSKKSVIAQPAAAFNSLLDDIVEKENKSTKSKIEDEEKKESSRKSPKKREAVETTDRISKSKKPVRKHRNKELEWSRRSMRDMLNERRKDLSRRVRERSCRLSRARSISKSISKTKTNEEAVKKEIPKSNDKRRGSIEDDEQALRESLLASLAMKAKEPQPAVPSPEKSTPAEKPSKDSIAKSTDEMPLAERVSAFLAKSKENDLKNNRPPVTATVSLVSQTTNATSQLKRASEPLSEAAIPPRKIMKRLTSMTPASKAVNNAKRYQNLMLQRKLTQQMGSAAIKSRFRLNHANPTNQARSASPVVAKSNSEIPKIIINLNEDTESEPEAGDTKCQAGPVKVRPTLNIPTTDFEKSVDQFLKSARQQQELASTANVNNVASTKPVIKNPSPMGLPPISSPTVSAAVTANTNVTTAQITVAIPPVVGSVGSIVATTADAVSMAKDKIVSTPKITKTTSKLPSAAATPTAVKHLTASKQEEYRRLKQILQERAKAKESTSAIAQLQPTLEKITTTPASSPLAAAAPPPPSSSSPTCPSTAVSSSTSKSVAEARMPMVTSVASSVPVTPREQVPVLNEPIPQFVATISPISKLSVESLQAPVASTKSLQTGITSTKSIPATPNINQNNNALNKTAAVVTNTSINKICATTDPEVTAPTLKATPQSNNNMFINKQQAALLGKMSEALTIQNKQISAVALKVSSLRILTKKQINLKTSQIQQTKLNSEGNIFMDDLNRTAENNLPIASKRLDGETNKPQSTKSIDCVTTSTALKKEPRKDSLSSNSAKISSTEASQDTDKTKQKWENFREVVDDEVQALSYLPTQQQKDILLKTEESLIEKRRSVVDDISEMSLKLREWEIERDLQYKYNEEAKKLREELRKVEQKIQQQKDKLNTIHPQVSLFHKKINSGRKECFKLSKICNSLGQQIIGSNYNVPAAGAEILNNRIKEVVKHTQKLQNKKTQYTDAINNNSGKTDNISNKKNFKSNDISKRKEIVEQCSVNNSKTDELASNIISIISTSRNEGSPIVSNNINTCTNGEIIVHPKIENNLTDTNTENWSTTTKRTNTNTNDAQTSTECTNSISNLSETSNLETMTKSNISNTILTTDSPINLKTEKILVNLNNCNEIEKTNQIFNTDRPLQDTESTTLRSENSENARHLTKNNSTIDHLESESLTNENNLNYLENQKCVVESSMEILPLNSDNNKNRNVPTVINVAQTISNVKSTESTNTENQTLQTVSSQTIIKTESEETAIKSIENPISVEKNRSMESNNPNLNNLNTSFEELSSKSEIQNMELDSENTTNELDTLTIDDKTNLSINNQEVMQVNNEVHEIKINLKVEDHTSNASKIRDNIENLSSVDVIQKVLENSKKKCLQPYESILKPLRAPGNNTNGFLCPFEMQGTCNDGDCKFIHSSLR